MLSIFIHWDCRLLKGKTVKNTLHNPNNHKARQKRKVNQSNFEKNVLLTYLFLLDFDDTFRRCQMKMFSGETFRHNVS